MKCVKQNICRFMYVHFTNNVVIMMRTAPHRRSTADANAAKSEMTHED